MSHSGYGRRVPGTSSPFQVTVHGDCPFSQRSRENGRPGGWYVVTLSDIGPPKDTRFCAVGNSTRFSTAHVVFFRLPMRSKLKSQGIARIESDTQIWTPEEDGRRRGHIHGKGQGERPVTADRTVGTAGPAGRGCGLRSRSLRPTGGRPRSKPGVHFPSVNGIYPLPNPNGLWDRLGRPGRGDRQGSGQTIAIVNA